MSQPPRVPVTKTDGYVQPFSERKLRRSLRRAGASKRAAAEAVDAVLARVRPDLPTDEIYRIAYRELQRTERPAAARYGLRRALLQLGPSGFPFERLIAKLLARAGYSAELDRTMRGRCIGHEIDVVATRAEERVYVECKYHNQVGRRTDVKVALYVAARAEDLRQGATPPLGGFWLVTNTKFTSDAVTYGTCAGLRLLGWDHPRDDGLKERLVRSGVVPLTCLTTLSSANKKRLLEAGFVTLEELVDRRGDLESAGVSPSSVRRVLHEIDALR